MLQFVQQNRGDPHSVLGQAFESNGRYDILQSLDRGRMGALKIVEGDSLADVTITPAVDNFKETGVPGRLIKLQDKRKENLQTLVQGIQSGAVTLAPTGRAPQAIPAPPQKAIEGSGDRPFDLPMAGSGTGGMALGNPGVSRGQYPSHDVTMQGGGLLSAGAAAIKVALQLDQLAFGHVGTAVSNVLSHALNKNPAWKPGFAGERHMVLPTEYGLTRANFAGPGTKLANRLVRGDAGVDGPSGIDAASRAHDIDYARAKTVDQIKAADKKFVKRIKASSAGNKTKSLVAGMMAAKQFGDNVGILNPLSFKAPVDPAQVAALEQSGQGFFNPLEALGNAVGNLIDPKGKIPHARKLAIARAKRNVKAAAKRKRKQKGGTTNKELLAFLKANRKGKKGGGAKRVLRAKATGVGHSKLKRQKGSITVNLKTGKVTGGPFKTGGPLKRPELPTTRCRSRPKTGSGVIYNKSASMLSHVKPAVKARGSGIGRAKPRGAKAPPKRKPGKSRPGMKLRQKLKSQGLL